MALRLNQYFFVIKLTVFMRVSSRVGLSNLRGAEFSRFLGGEKSRLGDGLRVALNRLGLKPLEENSRLGDNSRDKRLGDSRLGDSRLGDSRLGDSRLTNDESLIARLGDGFLSRD